MKRFSDWPLWLQIVVVVPHGILGFIAFWLWWPRSRNERNKFLIVAVYLFAFYLVMRYLFHFR
jgi:hypothetical protein